MILDERNTFANGLVPVMGVIGNVINLKQSGMDVGAGQPIYLVVLRRTATVGGEAAINLVTSDAAALTSPVTLLSAPIPAADAGEPVIIASLPMADCKQFVGITLTGTAPTAGTIDAFLTLDVSKFKAYPGVTGART